MEEPELEQLLRKLSEQLDELITSATILRRDVQRMTLFTHQVVRAAGAHLTRKGKIKQGAPAS